MLDVRRSFFVGFLAIWLAFAPYALAQKTSGTITGTVTDDSGAVVADANVSATSAETGATRANRTNSEGSFSFPELNPGVYRVTVAKQGFKTVETRNVALHVSDITNVAIRLSVGALTETVTVEASAVQVETQTGAVGNVVNGQQVRELPLNGRNFVQLTTLMPGAAVAEGFDPKNKGLLSSVDISFSGAPANANQWLVDGANNNDVGSQHTILIYPSIDAIEEFKILRNSYGPEYGGAGGSQVNIVTRGGGNDFHGSAFYFGRNDALNAKNYLLGPADRKQLLRRNDYGYTFGGPIKKDKIFFFWSEEWNKEKRARVRANQVPTALMRTGDFSEMLKTPTFEGCDGTVGSRSNQIPIDPATGQPFAGGIIPADQVSPAGQAWLSQISLPNRADPCVINWVQAVTIPVTWREENVRGDINITKKNVLTLRFTNDAWKNALHSDEEGGLWGEQNYPSLSGAWDQPGKIAIAKLTTTIGSTAVNDFSFSWSANRINVIAAGDNPALNGVIQAAMPYAYPVSGKLHGTATATPLVWGGGPSGLTGHFGPWSNQQDLFTWKDDFSKVTGRHTFKVGAYYSRNRKDEETGADYGQMWGGGGQTASGYNGAVWSGSPTKQEYGDFLLKGATFGYGEAATDGKARVRWTDLELYVGDSWKVRPRLTLEYGVRWSLTPSPYDAINNFSSFRPELYQASLGNSPCNGLILAKGDPFKCPDGTGGVMGNSRNLVPTNYHLFAPRLGFAWDVFGTGKFALRGGIGQFFARDPISLLVQIEGVNAPGAIAGAGYRTLDGPMCTEVGPGCPAQTLFFWSAGGSPATGIQNSNHIANNWQWNLTTETQLWKDAKLELGWVALRGIHLNSARFLNQVAPANRVAYINDQITNGGNLGYTFKPFGGTSNSNSLGNQAQFGDFGGSVYHSLQATFQARLTRSSQFQSSYTWSKNIADTTFAYIGPATGIADTYNSRAGRGNSDFDRRHIFNASLVYNLPGLRGSNAFVKGALGDWEASTIVSVFSGAGIRIKGAMNGACDTDFIVHAAGTTDDCDPNTGRFGTFSGNPWGIGNAADSASGPNRNFTEPCHVSSGSNRTQWLNANSYTWDGFKLGGYPNASPGNCSGPGVADVDFSILKNWGMPFGKKLLGEKAGIQFRLEFFNLMNHPMFRGTDINFATNDGVITNGTFSCVAPTGSTMKSCTSGNSRFGLANTPSNIGNREIQYALKLTF